MELTKVHVGVRTRARAAAITKEETVDNSRDVKRRRLSSKNLKSTFVESKTVDNCEIHLDELSSRSNGVQASCCSSTGSIEQILDLEESVEHGTIVRELKPVEMELTPTKHSGVMNSSCLTVLPVEKTPLEAEIEEFFAAAQEGINERFKNKFNYDIVNDIPLKGRFEWIQVKPGK